MKHWTTFKTFLVGLQKIIGELPKKSSHEYSIRPSASQFLGSPTWDVLG